MFKITLDNINGRLPFKQIVPQINGVLFQWPLHDLMHGVEVIVARREWYEPNKKQPGGHPKISACYKAAILLTPGSSVSVQDMGDSVRELEESLRTGFDLPKSASGVRFIAETPAA
ncbi:MAG: hypothetical protein HY918_01640 [Candidatus Doudnabacteria bacterium]|nr:hypothetical protein [Candidatus Doudnabacteria bacterium]